MPREIGLAPLRDVEPCGRGFVALSAEPWLAVDWPGLIKAAGSFVEITYRASLLDEPMRPVFRFETTAGLAIERIAAGPVMGAGLWIGRIPPGTIRVQVSPTSRPGRFDFAIERIRRRSWLGLLALGLSRNPRSTRSAILTRLIGWAPESDINLAWAIGAMPIESYERWRAARRRPIDLEGMDQPRFDWGAAPAVTVLVDARADRGGLEGTLASLQAQVFPHWRAIVSGAHVSVSDERVEQAVSLDDHLPPNGLFCVLAAGDRLAPHALACVVEARHRYPGARLFYGDEEITSPAGTRPLFKPGWSPHLQSESPYLGRAVFLDASLALAPVERRAFVELGRVPDRLGGDLDPSAVRPLRRVILERPDRGENAAARPNRPHEPGFNGHVAVIIPTRDQPHHLRRIVDSLRRFPPAGRLDIVIVDNGSVEPETKDLLAELSLGRGARLIDRPGPFNFSAMCNAGASATVADVLVFLNDDTEALQPGWLDRLCMLAMAPDVGAVGAKLTYPDGRLQHVGVLVGMGESAGHFGAFAPPEAPGWLGRHQAVHEVSAVTGACLAVAKAKFDAVGGFDAHDLPIELSDIDLCLKLRARGFATLVDPSVHLLHEESASRGGATFRRLAIYESQRRVFRRRWAQVVRDDPFFHPGLSLYQWKAALG